MSDDYFCEHCCAKLWGDTIDFSAKHKFCPSCDPFPYETIEEEDAAISRGECFRGDVR